MFDAFELQVLAVVTEDRRQPGVDRLQNALLAFDLSHVMGSSAQPPAWKTSVHLTDEIIPGFKK